ncbi:SCO2322 family protein [Streptomyces sp. NPDC058045]|uniref:SCO2322 family protein n=1 Tax=Streptomyces sp. NPDC058045 TaxID=3346311 RepID=UPI0036E2B6ED
MTRARPAAVPLAALLGLLLALTAALPAGAATGYRYWSFWQWDHGSWVYATQGPSVERPEDGAVRGFRFAVSADSAHAVTPRGGHDFTEICHGTPAESGRKRVALVLDFGTRQDAPGDERPPARRTACARVAPDASSAEALAAVAKPLRYNSTALLCAISGYPQTGCGEQVSGSGKGDTAAPTAGPRPATQDGHIPSAGLIAGIAAVAVLGGAAIWQARRRHR